MINYSNVHDSVAPNVNTKATPSDVADILDRRNESRRAMQINFWDEWEDVYRFSKCLTKRIERVNPITGKTEEDKSRTNVCMPETSLTIRRKTARLTANPPQINYTSPSGNDDVANKLTAWAYQQFDRSGEAQQHRKMVQTGVTFGWSVSKLYWDSVEVQRKFQRSFVGRDGAVSYRDRASVMKLMGAPDDEIQGATKELGPDLSDDELANQVIPKLGNTVQVPQTIKAYEGPCSKNIFIGDFFMEPGCESLDVSAWQIENYWESDLWLKKMAQKVYLDDDGQEVPVFDTAMVKKLSDMGSWSPNFGTQQPYDLRTRFRTFVLGQQVPMFPAKLIPGKRFDILEQHARGDDGRMWITWIGNETVNLGKMPYPWELYGKTVYTEFVPLFDIMQAIGDSIPRLHRFLQILHNVTVGQRKDLINAILKPIMLLKANADIPDEVLERSLFRILRVKDMDVFKPMQEPQSISAAISGAMQEEAQILKMYALSDPSLNNTESGTNAVADAGKTATTAVLAAKSADALTQFELENLHFYLKNSGQKKLWMLQQTESQDPYKIGSKYSSKVTGLVERYGKTAQVDLYPDEIQEDLEVEPESMSMLSVDDDIRRASAMQLGQMAQQAPNVFDPYYVARFAAGTIRGIDPDKAVPPPQPPQPPQPQPPKITVTVSVKWPELPAEVKEQILKANNVEITPDLHHAFGLEDSLTGLNKMDEAADAADNLSSLAPSHADALSNNGKYSGPETNLTRGVNG